SPTARGAPAKPAAPLQRFLAAREGEALGGHRARVIERHAEDDAADGMNDVPSAYGRGDQYSSRYQQIFRHGRVLLSDQRVTSGRATEQGECRTRKSRMRRFQTDAVGRRTARRDE